MDKSPLDFYILDEYLYIEQGDINFGGYSQIKFDFDQVSELYSYIVKHYINDIFLKELDKQE